MFHGTKYKRVIHEASAAALAEPPSFNSLDTCADNWYHKPVVQTSSQTMILLV